MLAVVTAIDAIGTADGFKPLKHPALSWFVQLAVLSIDMLDVYTDISLCIRLKRLFEGDGFGNEYQFVLFFTLISHVVASYVLNTRVIQKAPPQIVRWMTFEPWHIICYPIAFVIQLAALIPMTLFVLIGGLILSWVDTFLSLTTLGRFTRGTLYYLPVDEMDSIANVIVLFSEDVPQLIIQVLLFVRYKDLENADSLTVLVLSCVVTVIHILLAVVILVRRSKSLRVALSTYIKFLFYNAFFRKYKKTDIM
jgi:hypothetical protein